MPTLEIHKWQFAPETTCIAPDDYVDLEVIDISNFITDTSLHPLTAQARQDIIDRAFAGLRHTGFIVLTGHGLDAEAISRQFDIGKLFLDEVREDEKHRYHAKIIEEGSWAGYKPLGFHKRPNGARDTSEFHDFYPGTVVEDQQPPISWPYLKEIQEFYTYNHFTLLRTVLEILSEGLGVSPDSFWNLHHRQGSEANHIQTKDLFRSAMYHPPLEEDREKNKRLWLPAHTDRGSLTFIYSQPIAGLQVFINERWKYVRHYPNGILVNLGDALEFVTGHLLKAVLHRVSEPPPDQRHLRRIGMFYFATMLPEVPLQPIEALAARAQLQTDVFYEFESLHGRVPTAEEWQVRRAKTTGKPEDRAQIDKRFPTHVKAAGI